MSAAAPTPCTAEPEALEALLDGIDRGIESHLAWNQRLLRCALLREPPGDDVLHPRAHTLCCFGQWLHSHRAQLDNIDPVLAEQTASSHQSMHDAVRRMCEQLLLGQAASADDLLAYEHGQSTMVMVLNALRERTSRATTQLDVLTGLPLRHGLEHMFSLRRKDARRGEAVLWVAMIDVDRFKLVNDTHGHAVGDIALQHIAKRLAGCMRETDSLFRFGGEEFLALLMVREPKGAALLAQRLLEAVNAHPVCTPSGSSLKLSVTIGLAQVGPDESLAHATERADRALLQGKANGRNQFVTAPDAG
ncbi:MAG: diguanylate cyclase DgcZ [Rhizobacter sp.]